MRDQFVAADIPNAALDARLLAEVAFGFDAVQLAVREQELADSKSVSKLHGFAQRRLGGEPVARIIGHKEFFGLNFALNEATLVPRPETELVVELGLAFLADRATANVLDLGTGSGCILISLLHELQKASGVAVDLAPQALEQAEKNAQFNGVLARSKFKQGSWFAPLGAETQFDLIVSNPPYIESAVIDGLQKEVRLFDPMLALDGGVDGLAPYYLIAGQSRQFLRPDGAVIVEVGQGQADFVAQLFMDAGFNDCQVHDDLAGVGRVVFAVG